jgi:gluconate 2-dehydrogenase subunit 3-like protein
MSPFTGAERALLTLVLDRLVPADGAFPAAGALGVAEHVAVAVARTPAARRRFLEGITAIGLAAEARGGRGFAALSGEERDAVLREIESSRPEFFDELLVAAYGGYYSHPAVARLLGVVSPPQPRGYVLEAFDSSLLERVRQRPPLYRPAP